MPVRATTARAAAKPKAAPKPKPAGLPASITVNSQRTPTNSDGKLACAKLPFVPANDTRALTAAAKAAGMTALGNKQYMHPKDQSWVMMDANGRLQRGVKDVQFSGIPPAYVEPPDPKVAKQLEALLNKRPRVPASMKGYAIAKIGIINAQTAPGVCAREGFAQLGSTWVHPDGSWVDTQGGGCRVGWHGHSLDVLPYRNGSGWY